MPCWQVGFCICCDESRGLVMLRQSFHKCLKCAFPSASLDGRLLLDRLVVVKLHGHRPGAASAWGRAAAESMGVHTEAKDEILWWHIGCQSYKPYQSGFKELEFLAEEMRLGTLEVHLQDAGLSIGKPFLGGSHQVFFGWGFLVSKLIGDSRQ